jgi:hypothetical protein
VKTLLPLVLLAAYPLAAQSAKIPIRPLPAPTATSTETVRSLAAVRHLANGNVLVNDQAGRRVLLLDSTLKLIGVVADSTSNTQSAYGPRPGGLIAYRGDSTLFVDPASLSMLVIDPAGKIARVMAAPRPNDVQFLAGVLGTPGFDAKGRLIYRTMTRPGMMRGEGGMMTPPVLPDSEPLVRFDLASRKLDTAAFFKVYRPKMDIQRDSTGGVRMSSITNPLPVVDEWAVLSDGTLAIVRGQDYRVDFIAADGTRTKGEKIPYDWQRLSDDDKVAFVDSARAAITRARAAGGAGGAAGNAGFGIGPGGGGGGGQQMVIRMEGGGPPGGAGSPPPNIVMGGAPSGQMPPVVMVSPTELPDYKPVFGPNSVRSDADGRLWIRTIPTKAVAGVVYEVIDRSGKLVDRVLVPSGSVIVGFGPGGVVYMGMRDAAGVHVQRAVLK